MSHRHYGGNWPEREGKPHVYDTFWGKLSRLGCVIPMTRNCLTRLSPDEDPLLVHSVTTTDLDSTESKEVALDTIPTTWNLRFLKRWMGWARCWGITVSCALTQESRWGDAYTPTLLCPRERFSWAPVLDFLIWHVAGRSAHTIVSLIVIITQRGNDCYLHTTDEENYSS